MNYRGLTLLELVFVIMVITIVGTMTFINVADRREAERWEMTRSRLLQLRNAMIGDESQLTNDGYRTNFGYHGDIGRLPTTLQELATNVLGLPEDGALGHHVATNTYVGWRGPYLVNLTTQSWDYDKDAWGQALVYNQTKAPPEVASGGSDRTLSGGATGYKMDVVVKFPHEHTAASVDGYVLDGLKELPSQTVRIRYPVNGVLQNFSSTTNGVGLFNFTSVPFGVRSLQVTSTPTIAARNVVIANRWTVVSSNVLNFFGTNERVTASSPCGGNTLSTVGADLTSAYTATVTLDKITCWWTNNSSGYLNSVRIGATTITLGAPNCVTTGTEIDLADTLTIASGATSTFRLGFTQSDCVTNQAFTAATPVVSCKLQWTAASSTNPDTVTLTTTDVACL